MYLSLQGGIEIAVFKEGVALFDRFRNNTHFISKPCSTIVPLLKTQNVTTVALFEHLRQVHPEYPEEQLSALYEEFVESAKLLELIEAC